MKSEDIVKRLIELDRCEIILCQNKQHLGDKDLEEYKALEKQILDNQEKADKWDEYKEIQTFQHEQCKKLEQENKSMFSSNIAYAKSNDNLTQQIKELKEVVNAYNESELTKENKQLKFTKGIIMDELKFTQEILQKVREV